MTDQDVEPVTLSNVAREGATTPDAASEQLRDPSGMRHVNCRPAEHRAKVRAFLCKAERLHADRRTYTEGICAA